jgi:4-hydroxybenzoate polyprenyltransferase
MIGIMATTLIMLALCVYAIVIVYQDQMQRMRPVPHITYMAARAST